MSRTPIYGSGNPYPLSIMKGEMDERSKEFQFHGCRLVHSFQVLERLTDYTAGLESLDAALTRKFFLTTLISQPG